MSGRTVGERKIIGDHCTATLEPETRGSKRLQWLIRLNPDALPPSVPAPTHKTEHKASARAYVEHLDGIYRKWIKTLKIPK